MRKVIIAGGVAGGASCAARLRRLDEEAQIILFEKGQYISFANCGLPYHIGGVIEDRDELLLQTPESFNKRFRVDVRINSEVISIDREEKTVTVKSGDDIYKESYDNMVLATGSVPITPDIDGIENENIMQLWNVADMDRIIGFINEKNVKNAVVVGAGFIGMEVTENLKNRGISVTLIDKANHVMPNMDYDMAQILHRHMAEQGIKLLLNESIRSFESTKDGVRVVTGTDTIDTDMVILAVGIRPNSDLAASCGLKLNDRGGVVVDEYLRTSDENIYAAGDIVEVVHIVNGERMLIPLAGPANKMGRMAADNICGMKRTYKGSQGSSIAKVFKLSAASTGLSETQLKNSKKNLNRDYKVIILNSPSHASYYPGASIMTFKLIFDMNGKILGGQIVGTEGVDKRIDVLASAIRFGANVRDLEELELCYAPPFSSAKDPVNMAGFVAENVLNGNVDVIKVSELENISDDAVILDVRTKSEIVAGKIEGAVEIPVDELRERISELDKEKEYIVYCAVGLRAYIACRILMQNGFDNVRDLTGGYTMYEAEMWKDN